MPSSHAGSLIAAEKLLGEHTPEYFQATSAKQTVRGKMFSGACVCAHLLQLRCLLPALMWPNQACPPPVTSAAAHLHLHSRKACVSQMLYSQCNDVCCQSCCHKQRPCICTCNAPLPAVQVHVAIVESEDSKAVTKRKLPLLVFPEQLPVATLQYRASACKRR